MGNGRPGTLRLGGRLITTTVPQGGGAPIVDAGTTHTENGRYYGIAVIRRPVPSDRLRHLVRPNPDAGPCEAWAIGLADEPGHRLFRLLIWRPAMMRLGERARRVVHNVVAHPLLVLWPALGERLHDATAPRARTLTLGGTPLIPPDPPAGPGPTPSAPPAPEPDLAELGDPMAHPGCGPSTAPVFVRSEDPPDGWEPCPRCDGRGWLGDHVCPACGGAAVYGHVRKPAPIGGPVSDEELATEQVAPRRLVDRPQA